MSGAGVTEIKQIRLQNVNESMVLAQDVIDDFGRILVTAGTNLKRETVTRLANYGVTSVWINNGCGAGSPQQAKPTTERGRNREISSLPNLISAGTRLKMVQTMQNAFRHRGGIAAHLPYLRECINQVIVELSSQESLLIYLTDIRRKSDYLYGHCVDVGVFAVAFGMAMGLARDDIYILGIGGLLHDYGKTCIPGEILEKNGPLTLDEFEQVKKHASFGYNILRVETKVDSRIALMALQHHERPDGRGYPWGAKGEEIHPLARVIAVADVYDALVTDRVYRPRIAAHEAIAIINEGAGSQFDRDVVAAFNRITVPYYIGSAVKLDNGLAGAVLRINSLEPARPVVWTRDGIINLMEERDLKVVAVV